MATPKRARASSNENTSRNKKTAPANTEVSVAHRAILQVDVEEAIRTRAYELWEQHGRPDGSALQDWLRAESEIGRLHGAHT